jgi:glycerol-3-phosphate dehydrogenase
MHPQPSAPLPSSPLAEPPQQGSAFPAGPSGPGPQGLGVDVLVIGGGINGAGIARDLAGRGLSVLLCEKDDLAQHTSSHSSKLIHGGLRYLEHREFGLVRKSLAEREVLMRLAPHLVWPLRFVLPHHPGLRPAWLIRLGLFLYDHLAARQSLPGSAAIDLRQHPAGAWLRPGLSRAFCYSDAWVDDARLVLANALDAQAHGAQVWTRCEVLQAQAMPLPGQGQAPLWRVRLRHRDGHGAPARAEWVQARALVNAAGPWAAALCRQALQGLPERPLRWVRGSHIVLRRSCPHPFLFQNRDGRVLFVLPFQGEFTLVGTTDVEHQGSLDALHISQQEQHYLCEQASAWLKQPVREADIVWRFSGVRPLLDDAQTQASAVTRDYRLDLHAAPGQALALQVWGGKLTTYRVLAEEASEALRQAWPTPLPGPWTAQRPLWGGELSAWAQPAAQPNPAGLFAAFEQAMLQRQAQLPAPLVRRWARAYGAEMARWPAGLTLQSLGRQWTPGLFDFELNHLRQHEWAGCAEDVLWRRSKLGLWASPEEADALQQAWA